MPQVTVTRTRSDRGLGSEAFTWAVTFQGPQPAEGPHQDGSMAQRFVSNLQTEFGHKLTADGDHLLVCSRVSYRDRCCAV